MKTKILFTIATVTLAQSIAHAQLFSPWWDDEDTYERPKPRVASNYAPPMMEDAREFVRPQRGERFQGHYLRIPLRAMGWSDKDRRDFATFVYELGEDKVCNQVDKCIKTSQAPSIVALRRGISRNNPRLWAYLMDNVVFASDCADWPKYLEGVFAVSRGLPFSYRRYVSPKNPSMEFKDASGRLADDRYTLYGNVINTVETVNPENLDMYFSDDIVNHKYTGKKVFLGRVRDEVSTANFRTDPASKTDEASDLYSPAISAVGPGTMVYDPAGHIGIVSAILPDGRVKIADAHPDNTVSRKIYDETWMETKQAYGYGFKNIRPGTAYVSKSDEYRRYLKMRFKKNKEIASFSLEQYGKDENGFHDWVSPSGQSFKLTFIDKLKLSFTGGQITLDPLTDFRDKVVGICKAAFDRVEAVDLALAEKAHLAPHSALIPRNLPMGGDEIWKKFATAGRDSRMKIQMHFASRVLQKSLDYRSQGLPQFQYAGTRQQLAIEFQRILAEESDKCARGEYSDGRPLAYTKSDGTKQVLSLQNIFERAYTMSFDPFHCPELRWGATGAELMSCRTNPSKNAWYEAEQPLRNRVWRPAFQPGDYDLNTLFADAKSGKMERTEMGALTQANINLFNILAREASGLTAKETPRAKVAQ